MIAERQAMMTIQQASQQTGLSIHTLRYYERIQVLTPVERTASGHRRYSPEDVESIIFLNHMRLTGMPLEAIKQYAAILKQGEAGLAERITLLQAHRESVAKRLEELQNMLSIIDFKLDVLSERTKE